MFRPHQTPAVSVANKALVLTVACLAKPPACVRFIFTARPETARGDLRRVLGRAFGGVTYLGPHEARCAGHSSQGGEVLVFTTVVQECGLEGLVAAPSGAPSLVDLYGAYEAAFRRGGGPSEGAVRLLEVLMAAMEPLPVSLLQAMGLVRHFEELPGYPTLFFASEHRVYLLHKSLSDWLRLARREDRQAAGAGNGSWRWGGRGRWCRPGAGWARAAWGPPRRAGSAAVD